MRLREVLSGPAAWTHRGTVCSYLWHKPTDQGRTWHFAYDILGATYKVNSEGLYPTKWVALLLGFSGEQYWEDMQRWEKAEGRSQAGVLALIDRACRRLPTRPRDVHD